MSADNNTRPPWRLPDTQLTRDVKPILVNVGPARGASSFSVRREGGQNLTNKTFYCKGVEGPAPEEIFNFQRFSHACNLRHIGTVSHSVYHQIIKKPRRGI